MRTANACQQIPDGDPTKISMLSACKDIKPFRDFLLSNLTTTFETNTSTIWAVPFAKRCDQLYPTEITGAQALEVLDSLEVKIG